MATGCMLPLQNVATISAGNDRVIGDMIAEALDKVNTPPARSAGG
jgi:hypothetical protein